MKVVLAGFPRAGKTTVFQSLTGLAETVAASRGSALRGVIRVPDPRVDRLAEIHRPKKTTYATVVFVDVHDDGGERKATVLSAPLVDELKDADLVAAVLRAFPEPFSGAPADAGKEFARFEEELILADLAVVEKRLERLARDGKKTAEQALLERLHAWLGEGRPLRTAGVPPGDAKLLSGYSLVSLRPLLAVVNLADSDAARDLPEPVRRAIESAGGTALGMAGRLEREIAELAPEDQAAFLRDAGLSDSARDRFVQTAYRMLDLVTFLTTTGDEVRAWTVRRGTAAPQAAGRVHSDMEKGFIRAEVIGYDDFARYGSEVETRKAGRARLEGKEYVVRDGDIIHFRFAV